MKKKQKNKSDTSDTINADATETWEEGGLFNIKNNDQVIYTYSLTINGENKSSIIIPSKKEEKKVQHRKLMLNKDKKNDNAS